MGTRQTAYFLMRKREHSIGLSRSDIERAKSAIRVMNAYVVFGESLIRGEQPVRPPLSPQARREKRARWRKNKAARLAAAQS
jgi:hypothetical protein